VSGPVLNAERDRAGERPGQHLVELRDVFCVHRTSEGDAAALQGTTLHVRRGELVCVLGPSGAGKSTLLRVIAGLQVPSAGEVMVFGRDMGRLPARVRSRARHLRIGFLGQSSQSGVSPDLRVREAVSLPLALRGAVRSQQRERVSELLEAAGLSERADAFATELSGGERQRVALCVALAHRPELLLADEPTGELDAASARSVRALIAALAQAHGATVIVVSHDPATAEIAGRGLRMRDGRVVEDRRDGEDALVVGRGGWVRLPPELLADAAIGDRARVRAVRGGLMVTPAHERALVERRQPPAGERGADERCWRAARLELRALSRGYGHGGARRQVIDGLSLTLGPGRMTVITGSSGAGKTTLLALLAGLDRPESGELALDSERLDRDDGERLAALRRERIGYLPQEPSPVGFLSAEENVILSLRLRGWQPRDASERATEVLARLGLADRARQRVSRLSAGEGQRVALARALASARGLLIVDEPTSRLDEANAVAVAVLLATAAADDHQTVICATHDEQVIGRADAVVTLGG
jgi:ABC-type lipoprotein export system ATPase subunit